MSLIKDDNRILDQMRVSLEDFPVQKVIEWKNRYLSLLCQLSRVKERTNQLISALIFKFFK